MTLAPCPRCKRATPRTARGHCKRCRRIQKLRRRRLKRAFNPAPTQLVRARDLRAQAWDLFSVCVRAENEGCVLWDYPRFRAAKCYGPRVEPAQLDGAHLYARSIAPGLVFEPLNIVAACSACHRKYSPAGPEWDEFMRAYLPEAAYRDLLWWRQVRRSMRRDDYQLVILESQARIAALPPGPRREWALERAAAILGRRAA